MAYRWLIHRFNVSLLHTKNLCFDRNDWNVSINHAECIFRWTFFNSSVNYTNMLCMTRKNDSIWINKCRTVSTKTTESAVDSDFINSSMNIEHSKYFVQIFGMSMLQHFGLICQIIVIWSVTTIWKKFVALMQQSSFYDNAPPSMANILIAFSCIQNFVFKCISFPMNNSKLSSTDHQHCRMYEHWTLVKAISNTVIWSYAIFGLRGEENVVHFKNSFHPFRILDHHEFQ